jgi:hypothetical protein
MFSGWGTSVLSNGNTSFYNGNDYIFVDYIYPEITDSAVTVRFVYIYTRVINFESYLVEYSTCARTPTTVYYIYKKKKYQTSFIV